MSRHAVMTRIAAVRDALVASEVVVLGVLGGLVLLTVLAVWGRRWAAAAVVPFAFAWLLVNKQFEGPTLYAISYYHGVTATDLLSVAALLVAAWRLLPWLVGGPSPRR